MSAPEKTYRLIPGSSASELDDYYISPRAKPSKEDTPIDKNEAKGALLKENEKKARIEKVNFSTGEDESDHSFGESGANRGIKEKLMGAERVRKRKVEFSIGEIDAKGVRIEPAKDSKGPKLRVPQCRYEREEVRAGNFVSGKKKRLERNGKMPISKNSCNSGCSVKLESKGDLNGYKREDLNKFKCFNSEFVVPTSSPSRKSCTNAERSVVDGLSSSVELPECPSSTERSRSDEVNSRRGDVSTSGSSIPSNRRIIRLNRGQNEVKKKVKDQIRNMLFDAGWSIELRPRRNRDYEDSVYVSPQGTTYWSITKAYAAFQENQKTNDNPIATDELAMLKRNVRNKRGHCEGAVEASREAKWSMRKRPHGGGGLDNCIPYEWRRTVLSWLIDQGIVSENSKVKYMNVRRNKTRLKGRIRRDGIYCFCCSKILSVHKFELHAGSKEKQAYENIYVEQLGVSLTQCLLDAWKKQGERERKGFHTVESCGDDASDDTCGICGDGGDLICCDNCPSTFHMACLGIQVRQ
jgi:Tify domain binding domain